MVFAAFFREWSDSREGVTAIEFSLLAMPFMLMIIGIIELSLMFLGNTLLEGAVSDAARLIRTGQVQNSEDDPREMFADALCEGANALLDCDSIQFSVETLDSFADANEEPVFDEEGNMEDTPFDPGEENQIVKINVSYLYPIMTPLIGNFLSDYPGNMKLMTTTLVLQTEPYDPEDDD